MHNNREPPRNDVILFEPGDVPHVLSQIARLGEGLKAEFDLIAGRMSWLVIAESFIFSAFATVTASYRADHPAHSVFDRVRRESGNGSWSHRGTLETLCCRANY